MLEAKISQKTVTYGKNRYRYTEATDRWEVLMFGWWPDSKGKPDWRWELISSDRVPAAVKKAAK
jgi:hypothetical protein